MDSIIHALSIAGEPVTKVGTYSEVCAAIVCYALQLPQHFPSSCANACRHAESGGIISLAGGIPAAVIALGHFDTQHQGLL